MFFFYCLHSRVMAERCQSTFMKRLINHFFFSFFFNFFWNEKWHGRKLPKIITKIQLTLVLHFISSWPKTVIVDIYNICKGDTDIIPHEGISQYKKLETSHNKDIIKNYKTWIKKLMHGKNFKTKWKIKEVQRKSVRCFILSYSFF